MSVEGKLLNAIYLILVAILFFIAGMTINIYFLVGGIFIFIVSFICYIGGIGSKK